MKFFVRSDNEEEEEDSDYDEDEENGEVVAAKAS